MARLPYLLAAAALVLPLPAFADCAQRIDVVASHPAISEQPADSAAGDTATPAPAGSKEAIVKEQVVEGGGAVRENGGETVYQEGGPAIPRESWFTDSKDKAEVLTHLDSARKAKDAGDEKACLEAIEQAEKVLKQPDAG
jgi:hypothetical protein